MEKRSLKYVCVGFILCFILIMAISLPQTRLKQVIPEGCMRKVQILSPSISKENDKAPNSTAIPQGQSKKLKDVGASPVFSALSELDKKLQGQPSLPDIIELDYKPIVLTKGMNRIQIQDAIIALSLRREVVCRDWKMYGHHIVGGWPVCKAEALIPTQPCLVYSFGIRNDWSFDDEYRKEHGCIIRTFDPSMGTVKEHEHIPGVFFYPMGLSNRKEKNASTGWKMDTYKGFLTRFKEENKTISYLKFDIETMEWRVLDNMLANGLLRNVMQLSFEIHLDKAGYFPKYFKLMERLHYIGFRRWFYHHRLNGFKFQCDQSYINMNYIK